MELNFCCIKYIKNIEKLEFPRDFVHLNPCLKYTKEDTYRLDIATNVKYLVRYLQVSTRKDRIDLC